ncbi:hypothetical protein [Treponema succinifaciens]|uniref:hypothetical protein n=1 Tax=Treponema succinifaciens TaxID=167 RepID=UPI0023F2C83D|nr:hypothetical protein [Treponema succinifaciens]
MRKFAKISAVLAAMVLALAFAGCKSDDDDDDDAKPIQAIVINGDVVTLYDDGTVIVKASDGTTSNGTYTKADGKIVIKDSKGNTTEAKLTSDGKVDTSEPVTIKDKDGNEKTAEVKEKDTETNKGNGTSSTKTNEDDGSSSTKNILAGKTYYSIDFEKKEYTSETINRAKICISMLAFDSNGQKVKYTELKYDFKNGAVEENKDNIIESDVLDYSVSGSTLTIKAPEGVGEDLIATINSDGSIKDNEDGSVMKEFKGKLYAFAEAEADEKRLLAKAHIAIVDGASCTCESRTFKSNANPQEKTETVKGTVSGTNLTFTFTEDGKTETASGSLSDKEIVIYDPEGNLTLKRMKL